LPARRAQAGRHRQARTGRAIQFNPFYPAGRLEDLRVPPDNRLEALKGDRAGQHGIRVNDQLRVRFRWTAAGAEDVEIVDYH